MVYYFIKDITDYQLIRDSLISEDLVIDPRNVIDILDLLFIPEISGKIYEYIDHRIYLETFQNSSYIDNYLNSISF